LLKFDLPGKRLEVMAFNATFNNISVISWWFYLSTKEDFGVMWLERTTVQNKSSITVERQKMFTKIYTLCDLALSRWTVKPSPFWYICGINCVSVSNSISSTINRNKTKFVSLHGIIRPQIITLAVTKSVVLLNTIVNKSFAWCVINLNMAIWM